MLDPDWLIAFAQQIHILREVMGILVVRVIDPFQIA
jgi:hypothetical protein